MGDAAGTAGARGAPEPVGRDAEIDVLLRAFTHAAGPTLPVVLVVGEAGIGKSLLVRHALDRSGALAVVAEGDPAEADLDYGVVDQLVRRSPLDGSAVGEVVPLAGTDPLVAGAALMRFVDGLALDRPLVVVVDDAHWADRASLDAMTFAARRLRADQAVLCLTCRPEGVDRLPTGMARLVDGSRRVDLRPLDVAAVGELAARATGGPVPAAAAARLRAHTGGSPLHVEALLRELSRAELVDAERLPAPRSYATLVLARLAACSRGAQRLVEALAVLDRRPALTTVTATAGIDPASREGAAALDEALAAGMVRLVEQPGERSLVFAHPLIGAAVLDDLPASRREGLHRAAGEVLPGAAGVRHRLAGCPGHDPDLAAAAGGAADAEAARGAHGVAARLWAEAARVAPEVAARDHARLQAVDQHLLAGDLAAAARDRGLVDAAADGPRRSFMLGRLAYVLGPRRQAEGHLDRAWRQVTAGGEPADPALAGRIAALRATTAVDRGDGAAGMAWSRRALALAPDTAADCNHGHMLAMSCALEGRVRDGITELSAALDPSPASPAALADLHLGRGVLHLWAHDLGRAVDDLAVCLASWGTGGTLVARETARFFLAEAHHRAGRWDDAVVTAETAAAVVDETDQVWLAAFPHAVAVLPLAGRGEWERAERHLAAARAAADAADGGAARLWARLAALRLAESRGDPAAIVAAGEALGGNRAGRAPRRDEGVAPWRATYAEALAATGRVDAARAVADWLAHDAEGSTSPLVRADVARARIAADLAAGDAAGAAARAERSLAAGSGTERAGPFPLGQLGLVAGRAWLAAGEPEPASAVLTGALARFDALGAAPWVAAAERALASTGRRRRAPRRPTGADLTPQEQAVVHVVARGASNREAADELFLSVKTVEHHLSRAYAKLGVRSRTELARVVLGTPTPP
ncbi:MAG TPA: AAA family ATPase [Acidimicrobiales bacterium]|nr:AAA family ATPase [Acidimicrobiales bacterium]